MYFASIDRPWLEPPFAVGGICVQTREDIEYVAGHCQYVYVDPRPSVSRIVTGPVATLQSGPPRLPR